MTKRKHKQPEIDHTACRDATMARMAACRAALAAATGQLDEALGLFVVPEDDDKGVDRAQLLEDIDANIGMAAAAIQLAQADWAGVDPEEGEPDVDQDDDEDDDDEDE